MILSWLKTYALHLPILSLAILCGCQGAPDLQLLCDGDVIATAKHISWDDGSFYIGDSSPGSFSRYVPEKGAMCTIREIGN